MKIAVAAEVDANEPRVAATPETVKKMIGLGAEVAVEPGAGLKSGILDADFSAAGATVTKDAVSGADIVLKVRRPQASELPRFKKGAMVIAIMDPYGHDDALQAMAGGGITAFAMELLPRITRAQVMDVLSSQANLAGYRAVIDAAAEYGRALPMMMTAAGTVPATKVFIMGAGVAGLQAIATARRLGAIVTATDVRPAAKEQVESLGAKFIAVEDEEFKAAETTGGYAKEMSKEYQANAGSSRRRPHQEAGYCDYHRAHSGPTGATARVEGDGGVDAARFSGCRSCRRTRRQRRRRQGRRGRRNGWRQDHRLRQRARPACGDGVEPLRQKPLCVP